MTWTKRYRTLLKELDVYLPEWDRNAIETFIETELAAEHAAWLNGERCMECGEEKKEDELSNMCLPCFEEA